MGKHLLASVAILDVGQDPFVLHFQERAGHPGSPDGAGQPMVALIGQDLGDQACGHTNGMAWPPLVDGDAKVAVCVQQLADRFYGKQEDIGMDDQNSPALTMQKA